MVEVVLRWRRVAERALHSTEQDSLLVMIWGFTSTNAAAQLTMQYLEAKRLFVGLVRVSSKPKTQSVPVLSVRMPSP